MLYSLFAFVLALMHVIVLNELAARYIITCINVILAFIKNDNKNAINPYIYRVLLVLKPSICYTIDNKIW